MKVILLYSPFPSLKAAKSAAKVLLKEKLVACVNIIGSSSLYVWKGKMADEKEFILICKTTDKLREKVEKRVRAIHPYELPAIMFIGVSGVNAEYSKWVSECCKK